MNVDKEKLIVKVLNDLVDFLEFCEDAYYDCKHLIRKGKRWVKYFTRLPFYKFAKEAYIIDYTGITKVRVIGKTSYYCYYGGGITTIPFIVTGRIKTELYYNLNDAIKALVEENRPTLKVSQWLKER